MTIENTEYQPTSDESVLLSMDNIAMENETVAQQAEPETVAGADMSEAQSPEAEVIQEKVSSLLHPFPDNPAGQDPRYGDEFTLIKTEIDKLAFNDYNAVMTLAREILINESKDLRVAGYYLLASTYLLGFKGLIESLQLYRLLLERFGDCIYPERDESQRIALQWLNNSKLLAYVRQHQKNATHDNVTKVELELELFNELVMARFNDESLRLTILGNWLKETKKQLAALEQKISAARRPVTTIDAVTPTGAEQPKTQAENNVSQVTSAQVGELTRSDSLSDTDLNSLMRKIVNQLLDQKDYQRAVAFARATRWGGMIMPPNNQGKTALTPPRQSAVNEVTRTLQQGEFEAAFRLCESLFFEMGGHMLLDLQCYASKAAKGMGRNDLANLIAFDTAALLQRLPDIKTLRFDDDTQFANVGTLSWLNSLSGKNDSASIVANDEDNQELVKAINKSCEIANEDGLPEALAHLDKYRPHNEKQRFQLRLAMAQLCLDHGRVEFALPILEELNDQAESTSLALWDKQLALVVAKTLQSALRGVMHDAAEEDKARLGQRVKNLSAQMCRWDMVQAVQFI